MEFLIDICIYRGRMAGRVLPEWWWNVGFGGAKYQFPKSNQLTWKCKPHFSTRNFSSTFASIGDEWRAESSSRVAVKCGVGGAKYQFPKSNQLTFKFYVGNYVNNFWSTPKYHFLKGRWYGEWTPTWGLAILRFLLLMVLNLDQSSERSPSNFQRFQNGASRGN